MVAEADVVGVAEGVAERVGDCDGVVDLVEAMHWRGEEEPARDFESDGQGRGTWVLKGQ